jgi:sulfite reductase (NADPH) flavoprotein alpha-component
MSKSNSKTVAGEERARVPYLPGDLPFNDEQKHWMSGFLAGLHTRLVVQGESATAQASGASAPAVAVKPMTILYGTQTGNAESVAEDTAELARSQGMAPVVRDMDDVDVAELESIERLLIVTSTYGEGEMPDNAQALWDAVNADDAPALNNTHFSVLALGDTSYDGFCVAGKMWDERLAELGANRVTDRVDCDVDFETPAEAWMNEVVPAIGAKGSQEQQSQAASPAQAPKKEKSKYNRNNPLEAELITKRVLTAPESSKETVHYEFSLAGSGEVYNAGDALNIIALNRDDLVESVAAALGEDLETVITLKGETLPLRTLLTEKLEIRSVSKDFLTELATRSNDENLQRLIENDDAEAIADFLWGKDYLDLLNTYPKLFSAEEFCNICKPLAARAYSISSSINAHAEEVHLTIASVRYKNSERGYNGVCSTFLADIAEVGDKVKCYFSPNKNFAVPQDDELPIIMVGPGTGIAPFRAFLEERQARQATGENWLFFGDRNSKTDFIYEDEITAMQESGLLSRLDLAFSRDQSEKIYVQDRMREQGAELFAWLEKGAYFYVCGDAQYMAKDVDAALHELIASHGAMGEEQAQEYVTNLKKQKRYVRDVY